MTRFVVTYDLKNTTPSPYATFRAEAEKLKWETTIKDNDNKIWRLPNTTLIGTFPTKDAALAAFFAIEPATNKTLNTKITVEKHFIASYTEGSFKSNEEVKPPSKK